MTSVGENIVKKVADCDWRCVQAKKPKCICRCGGVNHARRLIDESRPLFLNYVPEVVAMFRPLECVYCGCRDLDHGIITGYPHEGGTWVNAMKMRLWLAVKCPCCGSEVSYKKLNGVDM